MATLRTALASLVVAAVMVTSGCHGALDNNARIVVPGGGDGGGGAAFPDVTAGKPFTLGDLIICLDRPGRVIITGIESIRPVGALRIDDFAVVPNDMEIGKDGFTDGNTPIAELPNPPAKPVVMSDACPADIDSPGPTQRTGPPRSVALLLQYSKATDATAGNYGIVIHYTSGGKNYTTSANWAIWLCAPGEGQAPGCGRY